MLQLVADVWDALRGLQRRWVAFRVGRVRESQPATARLEDFDRDHPRLVANLQAVETKSKAYGPALRALARLGVLESNAPAERKAKAESELCSLLKVVLRAQKLERFVDRERLVILDDDIDVIAE
jgi:hypothetical protein